MVQDSMEELFAHAMEEKVRLRPPPWLMPKGLRDFDYLHSPAPSPQPSTGDGLGVVAPDGPGRERNLLVFLHGFGGRKDAFAELAASLRLLRTAALVLNAPSELPGELLDDPPGFSWFTMLDDDFESIQPAPKERRRRKSLDKVTGLFGDLLQTLVSMCGWSPGELFLFGYGQGGTVALETLLRPGLGRSLGGVVGIATSLLPERKEKQGSTADAASPPSVLLIHGDCDPQVSTVAAEASAELLRHVVGESRVQLHVFAGRGGEMLRGGDGAETRLLMEFLSDHLHGVGRRGSEEAMRRLGAEPVELTDPRG